MEELDKDLTLASAPPNPKKEFSKRRKHRKIRRLGEVSKNTEPTASTKSSRYHVFAGALVFLSLAVFGHVYLLNSRDNFFDNFMQSYRRHYNQIVHGHNDYCSPKMDTAALFQLVRKHEIIHQDEALRQLEKGLHNVTKLNSIALIGPRGVGKSLMAGALQEHFPWPDNVHRYAWNTFVNDEVEKIHILRLFAEQLSNCGQNLIIIDNLALCDREVVNILNELIHRTGDKKTVTVLYIFNLNTMEAGGLAESQYNALQNIENTKTINFKAFTKDELKDCIQRESQMGNITLSENAFDELVKLIDVERSGCKNVYAKVLAYGTEDP